MPAEVKEQYNAYIEENGALAADGTFTYDVEDEETLAVETETATMADYEKAKASEHAGKAPCVHGDLCRQYIREGRGILRASCPRCEFYAPKE